MLNGLGNVIFMMFFMIRSCLFIRQRSCVQNAYYTYLFSILDYMIFKPTFLLSMKREKNVFWHLIA